MSEKEAKVYVALLESGPAPCQQVAIKAGVNRVTTYVILENFVKKGLIIASTKKKKTIYHIESTQLLMDNLVLQKDQLEQKIKKAKEIIPEISLLENLTSDKAQFRLFEGKEGIKMIQKDLIKSGVKDYLTMYNINLVLQDFPSHPNDHRKKLRDRKIKGKSIVVYDPQLPIPHLPSTGMERRYLPNYKFPFFDEVTIYKNKVVMVSRTDKIVAVMIENKSIVDGFKILFELAWKGADSFPVINQAKKKKK